jgi:STE24 endopeptidase
MSSFTSIDGLTILRSFLILRLIQHAIETWLSKSNKRWWSNATRQKDAASKLAITDADMQRTVAYTADKYYFGRVQALVYIIATILFLGSGGLGWCERIAKQITIWLNGGSIIQGLIFFGILILLTQLLSLPFSVYGTFVLEEKHGFNKQTMKGFITDLFKSIVLGVILGSLLLTALLWIMESTGTFWWLYAWATVTIFSLMTAWIYPSLLAPLFNKFSPLDDGELKTAILNLAEKVGFKSDGIFIMDASRRSGHGNAYFTGVFGKKRIVLFDTLIQSMSPQEVVAVLAHELGHFKLHHVRKSILRGFIISLVVFAGIGALLPNAVFYQAFGLEGASNYGGLVVFSLWFGLLEFYLQPLQTWLSRRNEFAADQFARESLGTGETLASALKKLREKSHVMPISHPLYSGMYYSHPPMLERIDKLLTQT